ncbi:hypothetical protein PYW07_002480 [Mythimna separata]|uniref:BTB domain-containing protein n=1 Tax=Mythimna separata TaxID=271217 RepID=A0AAD8DTG6_MYTSE|nr:hypothetical protein PYW07_002480 [Mythimna separata]
MAQTEQLSLSWDAHQKSICNGLSQLQQRGEFVDMTIAADGHHVKVHKMVLSLVSPYIKDLISTAQCPHPVIFLNNISYSTLCAILEYIYTGEVLVTKHQLKDMLAAGRALHIRGLKEMDDEATVESSPMKTVTPSPPRPKSISERLRLLKEKKKPGHSAKDEKKDVAPVPICKIYLEERPDDSTMDVQAIEIDDDLTEASETTPDSSATLDANKSNNGKADISRDLTADDTKKALLNQKVQYTVSNQGGLQVIHNRYIYHLRYFGKKNRKRLWRCVDYSTTNLKCPANICTDENNQVTERSYSHNHPFHDDKILKKLQHGMIYSVFQEAESNADGKKKERRVPINAWAPECNSDE